MWLRSGSKLAQVMACYLTAPNHYLNQCWLTIKGVLWHWPESNFSRNTHLICNICSKIIFKHDFTTGLSVFMSEFGSICVKLWHCDSALQNGIALVKRDTHSFVIFISGKYYHKISNIRHTKYPNLNVSHLVLQLSLPNPIKPDAKSRMKM